MTARQVLHGKWWLPTAPDQIASGMLILGEAPKPRLELHERLIDFHTEDGPFTIHGESGGHKISLLTVYPTESKVSMRGGSQYASQVFEVNFGALIGDSHINDDDEPKFPRSVVEIDYLTFISRDIDHSATEQSPKPDGSTDYAFTVTLNDRRSGQFGGIDVTTMPEASFSPAPEFQTAEMRIRATFKTYLRLDSAQPISSQQHVTAARQLSDLVTLAMHRPAEIRRISFDASATPEPDWYDWWGAQPVAADEPLDARTRQNITFDLADVNLATLLPAWHALNTNAVYGIQSIIGLQRETSIFHETKLLGVCGALEALHRGLYPAHLTYRKRCEALARIPSSRAVERVIPDVTKWADYVTKARNALAHGLEPSDRKVPEDVWFALHQPTLAVLILVLMAELGLPDKVQVDAVTSGALVRAARIGTTHLI
ncbi:HEPN domain-containing protein [Nocardia sp. NPDC046473]|uniref:ApeA N-terminal domain 1-containing protein n=1 Tax=Nocardia sp. NPDC046473 TaxID=3155733 RepID=UPI0033F9A4C0